MIDVTMVMCKNGLPKKAFFDKSVDKFENVWYTQLNPVCLKHTPPVAGMLQTKIK